MATYDDVARAVETATKQAEAEAARQARRETGEDMPPEDARALVEQIRDGL